MAEKTPFTETRIYPIIFMMILTIVFVGILAFFYHSTKERIEINNKLAFQKKVLMLFDLPTEEIEKSFDEFITRKTKDNLNYFEAKKENQILGNAFQIAGPGLWGTITAIVAVTPDLSTIIRFDILDQNETPGLGGRITESFFKDQFKNKPLVRNNKILNYSLIAEGGQPQEEEICQITGATMSSQSVTKMIKKELSDISKSLGLAYD